MNSAILELFGERMFLEHDIMVELGRIDLQMDRVAGDDGQAHATAAALREKRVKLETALDRLRQAA